MSRSLMTPLTTSHPTAVYNRFLVNNWPFSAIHSLFDEVLGEFQDRFESPFEHGFKATEKYPPMNVSEDENNWYIELAVAGHSKDTLSVEYKNGCITVRGKSTNQAKNEKTQYHISHIKMSSFQQTIQIASPNSIDEEKIQSISLNGVLTITLPKKHQESISGNARKISIS